MSSRAFGLCVAAGARACGRGPLWGPAPRRGGGGQAQPAIVGVRACQCVRASMRASPLCPQVLFHSRPSRNTAAGGQRRGSAARRSGPCVCESKRVSAVPGPDCFLHEKSAAWLCLHAQVAVQWRRDLRPRRERPPNDSAPPLHSLQQAPWRRRRVAGAQGAHSSWGCRPPKWAQSGRLRVCPHSTCCSTYPEYPSIPTPPPKEFQAGSATPTVPSVISPTDASCCRGSCRDAAGDPSCSGPLGD